MTDLANPSLVLISLALLALLISVLGLSVLVLLLLAEAVFELSYLCRLRMRQWRNKNTAILETTPLITSEELPTFEPRKYPQPICKYPAIDINMVSMTNVTSKGTSVASLPIRIVELPVQNIFEVAVLSWRWDFNGDNRSRTLACAIRYAQSAGIRFLFADVISLNQAHFSNLVQQVITFSALYRTIPVIAAYDHNEGNLSHGMARPWIFSEIQCFIHNPTKVVYVGHSRQGMDMGISVLKFFREQPARSRIQDTKFALRLRNSSLQSDFFLPALHVLNRTTNMTEIHDFKFIIPELTEILTVAEKLDRNDYLLTVSLLSTTINEPFKKRATYIQFRTKTYEFESLFFTKLHYNWYRVVARKTDPPLKYPDYDVFLMEKKLAGLLRNREVLQNVRGYVLEVYSNLRLDILRMLGVNETEFMVPAPKSYEALRLPRLTTGPQVDVVAIKL